MDIVEAEISAGYADRRYALSFSEFGEPRKLGHSGGWILVRQVPGTPYKDGMGLYPLFACRDWTRLRDDLKDLACDLVSLSLVTDPFCAVSPDYLQHVFDIARPFKTHYVSDLSYPLESFVDRHHAYYARKSLKAMQVECSPEPMQYLAEWVQLYNDLINRHRIEGIARFSEKSFEVQIQTPGMVIFVGRCNGRIVGATLVLINGPVAYSHLAAYTAEGYRMRASYGIHWEVLDYCKERDVRYFAFGGGTGLKEDVNDGLIIFKRGWANERRMVCFCGIIFDRQKYESICDQFRVHGTDYFPAYRAVA